MSQTTSPRPPVFDRASLLERVDGDADLLGIIVDVFLEDAPNAVGAIDAAHGAADAPALRLAAHALKGASANISAEALRSAAHDLEQVAAEGRLGEAAAAVRLVRAELAALIPVLQEVLGRGSRSC